MLNNTSFLQICADCIFKNIWWVLGYGAVVFLLWLSINYKAGHRDNQVPARMLPNSPGDFPVNHLKAFAGSFKAFFAEKLDRFMVFFTHEKLYLLVTFFIQALEFLYGIRGNAWDYARAFKTALIFYFIVIPLPAAFMPPVGGIQISPSAELLAATIMLILINTVGDMVSVNFSSRLIRTAIDLPVQDHTIQVASSVSDQSQISETPVSSEIKFYLVLVLDTLIACIILVFVLACSSIMYGVQIGEHGLSAERGTLLKMVQSALDFDRLFGAFYWFANDKTGFLGQPGIPGMLIFSLTTFLPTLIVGLAGVIWLLVLPVRILLVKEMGRFRTLIAAQACVFTICLAFSAVAATDIRRVYAFITTT